MIQDRRSNLQTPPWSAQVVGPWVRALAWVFVAAAVVAGIGAVFVLEPKLNVSVNEFPIFLLRIISSIYIFSVFLHVAIKGKAPSSWLPWK